MAFDLESAEVSSLSDGGTLSVDLNVGAGKTIIYVVKSDEPFSVTVTHHSGGDQTGHAIVQDTSDGTIAAGVAHGNAVETSGFSATVTGHDESSDGNDNASMTIIAKAV